MGALKKGLTGPRCLRSRICISQLDDELKGEALMSLGAFLKSADAMLVLWDPTYMDRRLVSSDCRPPVDL